MTEKRKLGKGLDALLSVGSSETMASLLEQTKRPGFSGRVRRQGW